MSTTPFLKPATLKSAYDASLKYMAPFQTPLDEYERIANNKPHPAVKDPYPKNTDGTVAGIIQDQPRRTIQQLPTGKVESSDPREWLTIVTNYYANHEMVPKMRTQADPLDKCWAVGSKALTSGSQPTMTMLLGDDLHADFKVPDVRAILYEAGKLSFFECNYYFLESYYQEGDLDAIIDQTDNAKKAGIDTGWDTAVLEKAKSEIEKKKDRNKSYDEEHRGIDAEGVLIVHALQYGKGAKQFSFIPALGDDSYVNAIAREKINRDPRGVPNVQCMYATVTLTNPLGRGIVELSGGMQNFIDSSMQMYQYTSALMLDPPLKKRGAFNKANVKYRVGHVIDMGADQNADVEPLKIETSALNNFNNVYQLAKSQILALNASNDTTISAEAGNPTSSKTPQGIKAAQAQLGIADNHFRKHLEEWWQEVITSAINLEFNEKSGVQPIQLDKDTTQKLMELWQTDPDVQEMLDPDTQLFHLDFDAIQDVPFTFTVDASSTAKEDNQHQLEALGGLNEQIDGSPAMTALMQQHPDKLIGIWNAMVKASGVEDPEKLSFTDDDVEQMTQQMQQQAEMEQQQQQQMAQQGIGPDGKPTPEAQMAMQQQQAQMQAEQQQAQAAAAQAANQQKMDMEAQKHQMGLEQAQMSHQQAMEANQAKTDATMQQMQAKTAAVTGKQPTESPAEQQQDTAPEGSPQDEPNMDGKVEPDETQGLTADEQGVVERLFQEEFPEALIEQAILMMRQGVAPEDIVPKLTELVQSSQGQAQ